MPARAAPPPAADESLLPYPKAAEAFPRLRQSLLATFDRCPLSASFALQYEEGWSTHAQARGKVGHRIWARLLELMYEEREETVPPEVGMTVFREELAQRAADAACPRCNAPDPERISKTWSDELSLRAKNGRKAVSRPGFDFRCEGCGKEFYSDEAALPVEHIADLRVSVLKWCKDNRWPIHRLVDVEKRLTAMIHYPAPLEHVAREVSGALDAVFSAEDEPGHAIVLDWKDTWGLPPESKISASGYFQQRFYALLIFHTYPAIDKVTLREFYVRHSTPREATITRQDLPEIEAELGALVERFDRSYERELWTPAPGRHCGFCPRPEACPIFPDVRTDGAIQTEDDAQRVANEITVARAVLEQRQRAMRAWTNARGPVPIRHAKGKRQLGLVKKTVTVKPDREKMEAELRRSGVYDREVNLDILYRRRTQTKLEEHVPPDEAEVTAEDARLSEALRASLERNEKRRSEGKPTKADLDERFGKDSPF